MDSGNLGRDGQRVWVHMTKTEAWEIVVALQTIFFVMDKLGANPNPALTQLEGELRIWLNPGSWVPKVRASSPYGKKMGDEEESG